jgi:hypothetical protein
MATSPISSRMQAVSSCQQKTSRSSSPYSESLVRKVSGGSEGFEIFGGVDPRSGDQTYEMRRTTIGNAHGVWTQVNDLPAWPYGLVQIQFASSEGDYEDLAALLQILIKVAQLVLRSPQTTRRRLMGAPLRLDTLSLVDVDAGVGPGVTPGPFYVPKEYVPYLPHVLGLEDIDLCVENSTNIVDAAARKQLVLAVLIAREENEESEFFREALNNLRRNTIPVDLEIVHVQPPWRRATLVAPALTTSEVRHPTDTLVSATPPSPSTPTTTSRKTDSILGLGS